MFVAGCSMKSLNGASTRHFGTITLP